MTPLTTAVLAFAAFATAEDAMPPRGMLRAVAIRLPTRLDWQYVAGAAGARAAWPSADYDFSLQRYDLFVPPASRALTPSPLVLFLSPGDDPIGWRAWQKVCEDHDVFFCSPYAAGEAVPVERRIRIALDALDDVRRRYGIDPARTYVAGLGSGARLACTLALTLPEYFGGVVAIGGGAALFRHDYLRQRAQDRLSIAVLSGTEDFARRQCEGFLYPLLQDLGVRSRLWMIQGAGHDLPPSATLEEVHAWLQGDLQRRIEDARLRPGLSVAPAEVPTRRILAERMLAEAQILLRRPEELSRATDLLVGLVDRCDRTDAADQARELLQQLRRDAQKMKQLSAQKGAQQRRVLAAEARALDRADRPTEALRLWEHLQQAHPHSPEAATARQEAARLRTLLGAAPYLGVQFAGETTVVQAVVPHGPAARAGLRPGDRIERLSAAPTPSLAELRRAIQTTKPGRRLPLCVRRDGRELSLTIEVGQTPLDPD